MTSQNGQTHFKSFTANAGKIFKMCLTIMGSYAIKGYQCANMIFSAILQKWKTSCY